MPEEWLDMGEGGGGGGGGGEGGGGGAGEGRKQNQQNWEAVNLVQRQDNLATYLTPFFAAATWKHTPHPYLDQIRKDVDY